MKVRTHLKYIIAVYLNEVESHSTAIKKSLSRENASNYVAKIS